MILVHDAFSGEAQTVPVAKIEEVIQPLDRSIHTEMPEACRARISRSDANHLLHVTETVEEVFELIEASKTKVDPKILSSIADSLETIASVAVFLQKSGLSVFVCEP